MLRCIHLQLENKNTEIAQGLESCDTSSFRSSWGKIGALINILDLHGLTRIHYALHFSLNPKILLLDCKSCKTVVLPCGTRNPTQTNLKNDSDGFYPEILFYESEKETNRSRRLLLLFCTDAL